MNPFVGEISQKVLAENNSVTQTQRFIRPSSGAPGRAENRLVFLKFNPCSMDGPAHVIYSTNP